jgi:hypothetical protein
LAPQTKTQTVPKKKEEATISKLSAAKEEVRAVPPLKGSDTTGLGSGESNLKKISTFVGSSRPKGGRESIIATLQPIINDVDKESPR